MNNLRHGLQMILIIVDMILIDHEYDKKHRFGWVQSLLTFLFIISYSFWNWFYHYDYGIWAYPFEASLAKKVSTEVIAALILCLIGWGFYFLGRVIHHKVHEKRHQQQERFLKRILHEG